MERKIWSKNFIILGLGVVIMALSVCLAIFALQGQMSFKMRLEVSPAVLCKIEIAKSETFVNQAIASALPWKVIHDNSSSPTAIDSSITRDYVNGAFEFTGEFFSNLTTNDILYFKITNLTNDTKTLNGVASTSSDYATLTSYPSYGVNNIAYQNSKIFAITTMVAFTNTPVQIDLDLNLVNAEGVVDLQYSNSSPTNINIITPQNTATSSVGLEAILISSISSQTVNINSVVVNHSPSDIYLTRGTQYTFDSASGKLIILPEALAGYGNLNTITINAVLKNKIIEIDYQNDAGDTLLYYPYPDSANFIGDGDEHTNSSFTVDSTKDFTFMIISSGLASNATYTVLISDGINTPTPIITTKISGGSDLRATGTIPQHLIVDNRTIIITTSIPVGE